MFLPQPFSNGLARLPRNFFWGSLIPRQPLGGGRNATQSASRGSLVVQYWPDYKVANRLVQPDPELSSKSLRQNAHLLSNKKGKEGTETVISEPDNIFSQLIQRYFLLEGSHLSLLYRAAKACIWLKLSPPVFFQLCT